MIASKGNRPLLRIFCFGLLFLLGFPAMGFILTPPVDNTRLMFHDLAQKGGFDVLYIGTSHVFCGFDPAVLAEITGQTSFNAATSQQNDVGQYYMLKEVLRRGYRPKTVVMEIGYNRLLWKPVKAADWKILDPMPLSLNKLDFVFNRFPQEEWAKTLAPSLRSNIKENLFKPEMLSKFWTQKTGAAYNHYAPIYGFGTNSTRTYEKDGYVYTHTDLTANKSGKGISGRVWYRDKFVVQENLEWLQKSVELVQSVGAKVILVEMPAPMAKLFRIDNHGDYQAYMQRLADQWNCDFFPFALVRSERWNSGDDTMFCDWDHMSGTGSQAFSRVFGDVLNDWTAGTLVKQHYFYPDRETLQEKNQSIYTVGLQRDSTQDNVYTAYWSGGTRVVPEFEFAYRPPGASDYTVIQPFSAEGTVILPSELNPNAGNLRVVAREAGGSERFFVRTLKSREEEGK